MAGGECFTPIPDSMRRLSVYCGLPVPWFAAWREGRPVYGEPLSEEKFSRAVARHVCIVCGGRLRRPGAFMGEAAVSLLGVAPVPPAHRECAAWALVNLRAICRPEQFHRVKVMWVTRAWGMIDGARLFDLGAPEAVEWYRQGRSATRVEVEDFLDAEMFELASAAEWQGGLDDLWRRRSRLERWLPGK